MGELRLRIERALSDSVLRNNLDVFYHNYKESHRRAYEGFDFNKLKREVGKIKFLSKEERLKLFEEFKKNVEQAGAKVFEAKSSKEACDYIVSVCKRHNSEYVVKSKSMTAEEIGLNAYLEKNGIKPVETDLGEWIIQLAKETPSHMIMPAIHKNRKQVARLFREHLGVQVEDDDIEGMVKIARHYLREFYFKARVGITGANVAVSETGTVGIVTNEGNGRLTTTIPPVHIVVLGYEKLVKTFKEALKIIRVLPKNATGQIISVYVSWIKGAVESLSNPEGRKEIHFVFVDNGRKALMGNPYFDEAMKCIRCGSCANVCPSYGVLGGHVFGHIYTGPIGAILTSFYHDDRRAMEILSLCCGCKACSEICPAGIELSELIADIYGGLKLKYGNNKIRSSIYSNILSKPGALKSTAKIGSLVLKSVEKKSHLKGKLTPKRHDFRVLPLPKSKSFSAVFKEKLEPLQEKKERGKRVFFYPGCAIEYVYPEIGLSMVRLLNRMGLSVSIPDKMVCCGFPAIHDGDKIAAKKIIRNNTLYLPKQDDFDYFLILCPTCGTTIKSLFSQFTLDMPKEYERVKGIENRIVNFSKLLDRLGLTVKTKGDVLFTYHVPCHQNRGLHFSGEGFLRKILPQFYIPMRDRDRCCGFGGSFSIDYPEVSKAILDKKIENIVSTSASVVVTECPGCIMQIRGGIMKRGLPIEVLHLSEFLDRYVEVV